MKSKEKEFDTALQKLQQEPVFHLPSFEKEIDRIKSHIAEVSLILFLYSDFSLLFNIKHSKF